ncbi:MAG: MATE family efflux transporter [Clostridiales bacterium]|nr:MATE family efflux transporter [Clostridiales bacterium]
MEKNTIAENKMGVMSEGKLLLNMATPMIISMLVQAMYNIVDSVFVGMFDPEFNYALAAVNLAFPIQTLMIAVSVGIGVGVNSFLSRSLGEKNFEDANFAAGNGIFLSVCSYVVFAVIAGIAAPSFYAFQTDVPKIIEYGTSYVRIVTIGSIGIFVQVIMERILQSTGQTFYNMISQGTGAIVNIVFDYLLIFGVGPFPAMGVAGAAAATVFGQIVGASLGIYFNIRKNHEISLSLRYMLPKARVIKQIFVVGLPSIIMQSIASVLTVGINKIIALDPSQEVVTAGQNVFGAYFKLQSFVFMPVFGLNNGMVPIIAYNYGARNKKRIMRTYKIAVICAMIYMCLGLVVFSLFPGELLALFSLSEQAVTMGIHALRIMGLSFLFAGFSIITVSTFQALGNGIYSMINSLCRQLIVILPAALLFYHFWGVNSIWYAFPLAEVFSVMLSIFFMVKLYNQKLKHL